MANKWMCILIMKKNRLCLSKLIKLAALVSLSCCLISCTVGPNYLSPKIVTPARWKSKPVKPMVAAPVAHRPFHFNWWTSFHDPVLNQLIERSIANNLDLKAAKARILQARSNQSNAFAKLYPTLNIDGIGGRFQPGFITQNNQFNLAQGSLDATWELDLFGGKKRKLEAENDFAAVNIEEHNDILLSLIAEVANNYLDVRMNQRQLQIINKNIAAAKTHLELTMSLKKSGISTDLDVMQAKSQYQKFQAAISLKQIALNAAKNRLTTLLGLYPGGLDNFLYTKTPKIPGSDDSIFLSIPSEVLRQRPDVRKAEYQLAGQTALIGEAIAQLFPDLSIGGFYGKQSTTLFPGIDIWGIAPRVYLPLLNFGRIQSQINLARAREREAFFIYKNVILNAMEDVENKITDYANINQREQYLIQSRSSNQLALELSIERYKRGLTSFINVTQTELSYYDAKMEEISVSVEKSKHLIAIYKCLGVRPVS